MSELLAALVVGAPAVAGIGSWFAGGRVGARLAAAGMGISIGAAVALIGTVFSAGSVTAFGGAVAIDALGAYILGLVLAVAAIAFLGSPAHLAHEAAGGRLRPGDAGRYYALLLWFAAGLAAIPLLDNLGLVWVGIEATTVVSALLVGFGRTSDAIEAAWKYLILGSIGIGFALLGTLLLFASSVGVLGETSDALAWTRLLTIASHLDPALVRLAFLFALAGYGTKIGLAPFHTWLPDAHSQAPSPISALLSGAALAVALYALARFHLVVVGTLGPGFSSSLLVAFGLLSLAVALPFIVAQRDVKRLLAYSSIEHLGLASLALGFGGHLALLGLTLHLVSHGLAKAIGFLSAGHLVNARGSRRIGRLRGVLATSPAEGRAFFVAAGALAGLPPSGIFIAELAILFGGVRAGWGLAAAAAATLLALSMAGLLFHLVRMGAAAPGHAGVTAAAMPPPRNRLAFGGPLLLAVPLLVVAVAGIWTPSPIAHALDEVVVVLGGGHG